MSTGDSDITIKFNIKHGQNLPIAEDIAKLAAVAMDEILSMTSGGVVVHATVQSAVIHGWTQRGDVTVQAQAMARPNANGR